MQYKLQTIEVITNIATEILYFTVYLVKLYCIASSCFSGKCRNDYCVNGDVFFCILVSTSCFKQTLIVGKHRAAKQKNNVFTFYGHCFQLHILFSQSTSTPHKASSQKQNNKCCHLHLISFAKSLYCAHCNSASWGNEKSKHALPAWLMLRWPAESPASWLSHICISISYFAPGLLCSLLHFACLMVLSEMNSQNCNKQRTSLCRCKTYSTP